MKQTGGKRQTTAAIMRITTLTMTPAVAAATWVYGIGVLLQVAVAMAAAVAAELLCLYLRKKPLSEAKDGSAIVAGIIIAIALPPLSPWFVAVFAAFCAMTLAKHCYGGLGNNVFNPAMAGYALAFVSFPLYFDNWHGDASAGQTFDAIFGAVDAVSSPTPLIAARLPEGIVDRQLSLLPPVACIVGGAVLLILRIADWRLSAGFAFGAAVVAAVYDDMTILLHGGLAFAMFFVITDPATAAASKSGRLLYAFFAGALALWLRQAGAHADGIAFAILAANMTAPLFDKVCGMFGGARHD
ncbi:MAG: RnfABCDGE type electron transport complex subunit D [Gammaproteobacteria bacterium]